MSWQPIEDISHHWQNLANSELPPLVKVWKDQAERLRTSGEFKVFMEKLRREIAIETGVIERLYTIDRGITRLLIEQGINEALIPHGATDQPVKRVVALIKDQEAAVKGLFDFVGQLRSLSTSYIKQLHQALTRNQNSTEALVPLTGQIIEVALLRGDWKKHPNNPLRPDGVLHEYCPPEQVSSEMDKLIEWHRQHLSSEIPPEIEAAWLHHRFTQIHPFQDGNGRVARCLASLVFIQAGWFPLVLTRDDRGIYIDSLEKADQGDLSPLIELFSKAQKQAFIRSLGLSEQVLSDAKRTQLIIASVADKLKQNHSMSIQDKKQRVEAYAETLFGIAQERLSNVAHEIELSIKNLLDNVEVFTVASPANDPRSYYHRYQVVETAKQLDYFADTRSYHSWLQLVININNSTILLVSFHSLGHEYLGLLACSACAYHRDKGEEGELSISDVQALSDTLFQFSYADEEELLVERFKDWLEKTVFAGLDYWNKSL